MAIRNRVTGKLSSHIPVTLDGEAHIDLCPNTEVYSDEIELPVSSDDDFVVTMYFSEKQTICSACVTWSMRIWQSYQYTGDYTKTGEFHFTVKEQIAPGLCRDPNGNHFVVGLSEIAVYTGNGPTLIGLFGDSITQMSLFSDPLTEALYERFPGKCSVINGGICGNRIERTYPRVSMPGEGAQFGISGRDRIEKDLYNGAEPDVAFIMEGINDCSHAIVFGEQNIPTAEDIYGALAETAEKAKKYGSRVYVATVMPLGAFGAPWREEAESIRLQYNDLIRAGGPWDDMIDLDALLRDPDDMHRIQEGMHLGDYVHPGPFGGRKMAKALMDKWFTE